MPSLPRPARTPRRSVFRAVSAALGRCAVAALFTACAQPALAAPYPDEAQLREAISGVTALARAEGMPLQILDARKHGVQRPLMAAGLSAENGTCMVFFTPAPADILMPFFERMAAADVSVWLKAIAVHEITHCIEQREGYVLGRFDRILPPGFAREGMTVQGYVSALRSGSIERWGEALADIAAVLWLQKAVPADWRRFAVGLVGLREELAERNPSHLTAPWLQGMLGAGLAEDPERSLFETAFRLRGVHNPH